MMMDSFESAVEMEKREGIENGNLGKKVEK